MRLELHLDKVVGMAGGMSGCGTVRRDGCGTVRLGSHDVYARLCSFHDKGWR